MSDKATASYRLSTGGRTEGQSDPAPERTASAPPAIPPALVLDTRLSEDLLSRISVTDGTAG